MFAGRPAIFQNSAKYRDAGTKPATGRSGSAAIQARALRGQTETVIEVTTGQFDGSVPAAGKLDKVQIKLFDSRNDVLVTDNYRKGALSGSYGSFVYGWPARGQKMQVQANVSGIDPNRTDVVTVVGNVANRPDLTVASIQAPNSAFVNTNVTISAVVREINGDLGARANCVLKVDGVVADHADGIWVDAGDSVTCEFRQVFSTLGTKQLSVEVTNVAPADYDNGNNSATAAIDIVSPHVPVPVWYTFSASDYNYEALTKTQDHQQFDAFDSAYLSWTTDNDNDFHLLQHTVSYQADLNAAVAMSFPVTVQSSLTIDGGQAVAMPPFAVEATSSYSTDGFSSTCGQTYESNRWFSVCKYRYDFGGGSFYEYTAITTFIQAGTVTYDGHNVSITRYPDLGQEYVYEYNYGPYTQDTNDPQYPLPNSLGNNVVIHATATDADDHHFDVEAAVQLFEFPTNTQSWDNPCTSYDYSYDYGRYSGQACSHTDAINSGKTGVIFGFGVQ